MFHWLSRKVVIAMVAAVVVGMGCAVASGQPAVKAGAANTGPGSVEAVQRKLEGTLPKDEILKRGRIP